MDNKGFTLVELLAVLVILTVILLIAIPGITSSLDKSDAADLENRKQVILSEAELKLNDTYKSKLRENVCSYTVDNLLSYGIITKSQSIDKNGNKIDICIGYNINNELDIVNCVACP